jgi:tetratricopeptide (TPR) repeat protein
MTGRIGKAVVRLVVLAGWMLAPALVVRADGGAIPREAIAEVEAMVASQKGESSAARKRLAAKRAIRAGEELIDAHPDAANRFEVLGVLFRARQGLLALEDSPENRQALLETCRRLSKAPDAYADIRLDADLLLTQAEAARGGADAQQRMKAIRPLVARYRDTPAEARLLRIATLLALEVADQRMIDDLRETMEVRFARDPEMIEFMREKLGGQVFGAPFCGVFETAAGQSVRFPMDGLGRTTLLFFWSKEDGSVEELGLLAAACNEMRSDLAGRIQFVSLNVDDLPDAGTSILRGAAADWPALRLPGGRDNPVYRAFGQSTPRLVTVSPTGYAAIIMAGTTRTKSDPGGQADYRRVLGSALAREWNEPEYLSQLQSLLAGEFLVVPVGAPFDAGRPPEFAAVSAPDTSIPRTPACVPERTLLEIQGCFTPPPERYRLPLATARADYERAADLCRKAIAAHPAAPDLWIVRNRLVVSLLGSWKVTADRKYLDEAIVASKAAIAAGSPAGTDVVPRLCLAREALRAGDRDPRAVITEFVAALGGEKASGPALMGAVILALETADRESYEDYRRAILEKHTEHPMMWTAVSFLLDRHHQYQLFLAPFTAGWTPGRRSEYVMSSGAAEDARRTLRTEFKTLEDGSFRIPEDLVGKWTAIVFAAPWRKDGPPSPERTAKPLCDLAGRRPGSDVAVILAVLDDDAEKVRGLLAEKPLPCPVMLVPGGIKNPVVQRLGILAETKKLNAVLLRPDGSIAVALSGFSHPPERSIPAVIEAHDERAVVAALDRGDVEEAKRLAFSLAPPPGSEPLDAKGRPIKNPPAGLAHLRSRARVYMALGEWENALADAEELVQRETDISGGLSMRTDALDEAEELRDRILRKGRPPE